MKSLQDYINTYKDIANNLNIGGDSAELLIQLLANASYISEVENIMYSQEASLERSTQLNSKIQHCIELMYSIYRGQCPRVIMNIRPQKPLTLNKYDEIISSNNFKVYYLGTYDNNKLENIGKEGLKSYDSDFDTSSSITLVPDGSTYKIIGLIAKEVYTEEKTVTSDNRYYVDFLGSDLSNDLEIKISGSNDVFSTAKVTRQLSEHILKENSKETYVFDLTLTDFSSRIYLPETVKENSIVSAKYFKLSTLSSYNESELKRINMKGVEMVAFSEDETGTDLEWLKERNMSIADELSNGLILVKEVPHDDMLNIHYKANKNRYLNTIFRSNYDIGELLKEHFSDNIKDTNIIHDSEMIGNSITIYYIPREEKNLLSTSDIENFKSEKGAYYISTDDLSIVPGTKYNILIDIVVELYENDESGEVIPNIESILNSYSNTFNTNLIIDSNNPYLSSNSVYLDIQALINKIENVKRLKTFNLIYSDSNNNTFTESVTDDHWNSMLEALLSGKVYYSIKSNIRTII